jgi:hypothetical protein
LASWRFKNFGLGEIARQSNVESIVSREFEEAEMRRLDENIAAHQFPAGWGLLTVYAKLTDAQGDYRIRLELIHLSDLTVIGQGQFRATISDRMVPAELVFQIGGLVFQKPGPYEFRLYANDRWVGSKSLRLVQAPEPVPQPEHIRVSGSTVTVRWLSFMLLAAKPMGQEP